MHLAKRTELSQKKTTYPYPLASNFYLTVTIMVVFILLLNEMGRPTTEDSNDVQNSKQ